MEDGFRFSLPPRPEGEPISADEAERILRARVAEQPAGSSDHRAAVWQLVRFFSVTGRMAEGLEILERLLVSTVEPGERAGIFLAMGQLMEKLRDFPGAITAYSRGVALESGDRPTAYLLHNNLGYSLNQLGRHAEAERWCRGAISIDSRRHNAHKNLGLACQGQGRYAEAVRSFIRAVQCEAGDARALSHLRELVQAHPEITTEIHDLREQLERCSMAVAAARLARGRPPENPSQSESN